MKDIKFETFTKEFEGRKVIFEVAAKEDNHGGIYLIIKGTGHSKFEKEVVTAVIEKNGVYYYKYGTVGISSPNANKAIVFRDNIQDEIDRMTVFFSPQTVCWTVPSFRLESSVDKRIFNLLLSNGLYKQEYDEETESRFSGWAINGEEKFTEVKRELEAIGYKVLLGKQVKIK
ncbi:hypothetical protein ACHHV8_11040 [Paenibacillus sp. TAB 01]|uniref:hypothetical protein n=1 Tax=Paenibacillus sp. TAB 01 TaxID=3368988 RepID=UPI0037524412